MNRDLSRRFDGKHVLITGAASGIGKASALRFASEGAHLTIIDLNLDRAIEVVEQIKSLGCRAVVFQADVSQPETLRHVIDKAIKTLGDLNVVFTNAGIGGGAMVDEMPIDLWDRLIRTNLDGTFYTIKYAIPSLIKQPGNAIVTMASSMAGWDTSLRGAAYMASKEGVTGLTKSLALQLARYDVRVNAICPGVIETNLGGRSVEEKREAYAKFARHIPLGRVGQPEDVAAAVAFLASYDARHVTGSMLLIDGGQTLQSWSNAPVDTKAYPNEFNVDEFSGGTL